MLSDFKILFSLRVYRILIFNLALTFFAWSFYYTSFAQWIKHMYGLNQAQLGIDAALIEGIGNVVAIMAISYLSTTEDHASGANPRRKLRLEAMMVYFALVLVVSVGAMLAINFAPMLQPLLGHKAVVYALICGYLCGSEGVI